MTLPPTASQVVEQWGRHYQATTEEQNAIAQQLAQMKELAAQRKAQRAAEQAAAQEASQARKRARPSRDPDYINGIDA